jgi:large subunit ribosomal protein L18
MGRTNVRERRRKMRRQRVRKRVQGTTAKPRLCVFRSNRYTYAQLIADDNGAVLLTTSSRVLDTGGKSRSGVEAAKLVGMKVAELAKAESIAAVVFDRNGYLYHGRVKGVAEGAREGGLKF